MLSASLYAADSDWKIHPIFDEDVTHLVETPAYVYFTSLNMKENRENKVYKSLFRYDKAGEELQSLSVSNILNGNNVSDVIYNPQKGYLAVLYHDFNLDLLHNDGRVTNIPYYSQANLSFPKNVYSMSIDKAKDRLYLATDFGYVAINDKKFEVAESRIYSQPFLAFGRTGDYYVAIKDKDVLVAPVSDQRLSIDTYETVGTLEYPGIALYPLNDKLCILEIGTSQYHIFQKLFIDEDGFRIEPFFGGNVYNVDINGDGLNVSMDNRIVHVNADGSTTEIVKHPDFLKSAATTNNMTDVWIAAKRKGLSSMKKNGDNWTLTRDWMLPNAPATFATTSFANHPSLGLLMLDYGTNRITNSLNSFSPLQLSSYKQGRWKNHAPAYTNPDRTEIMTASNGMVIDPDRPEYVYITSYHNGILRLNLNDGKDLIHLGYSTDADKGNDGYVELGPEQTAVVNYWNLSPPHFDKDGNLWINYPNWNDQADPNPHFYVWTAADRRATTSAADIRMPKEVEFNTYYVINNSSISLPLLKTGKGLIVYAASENNEGIAILDTNGTPLDTQDDKIYKFESFSDNDGNYVEMHNIRNLWEDPDTGYVWIMHLNGLCHMVPSQVVAGNYRVNRVKVARNDGTNLADYLFEGVQVNQMVKDAEGRLWFATTGGGVVCTSGDGREILAELTTSNSPLPDDVVYGIAYNEETNSLMLSTALGYAEYMLPSTQTGSDKQDIRAYPNPVRPEYSGYVTITDIPMGSFVKITDAAGNLVKELGTMTGFEILWDISDANYNRVKSGVYHIMASPSNEDGKYSGVGKILVIS